MARAREMWNANRETAVACLRHPFVQGIATGDLPRPRFTFYVGQDAHFLDAYARAYALALAKAPDRGTMEGFRDLLGGALGELGLHRGYAARWGVDLTPEPAPATAAYTDFLLRVAWSEPAGHIAAAMAPCMRLYAFLGQELRAHTRVGSPYLEWVQTYSDPAFEHLALRLEDLLNRLEDSGPEGPRLYRTAMRLELAFFEAAWRPG